MTKIAPAATVISMARCGKTCGPSHPRGTTSEARCGNTCSPAVPHLQATMSEGRRLAALEVLLVFLLGPCLALVGCRGFGTWRLPPRAIAIHVLDGLPVVSGALHDGHRFQLDGCPALPPLVTPPTSCSHFLQDAPIGHTPSVQDLCIPDTVNSVTPIPTVSHTSLHAVLRVPRGFSGALQS